MSCHNTAPKATNTEQPHQELNPGFRFDDFHFLDSLFRNKIVLLWKNQERIIDSAYLKDSVRTVIDRIDTLILNGRMIYAVQTESRPPELNFHTAGALCLISFFERDIMAKPHFVKSCILYSDAPLLMGGSWGWFPKTELIKIGPHRYAYQIEPGFTGQGITSKDMLIFEISDSLNILESLSFYPLHYDNAGMCSDTAANFPKCFSYSTSLDFLPGQDGYYDIKAYKKGTDIVDDKIINIDSTFYYTYKDRRYVLTKTVVNEKDTDSK